MRPYIGIVHYDRPGMTPETKPGLPKGLLIFRPGTDPARRRRRLVFLAVYLAAAAFVVWPIYPLFAGIRPLVLGLPLSLAWVVLALAVMFVALVWLYRGDDREG